MKKILFQILLSILVLCVLVYGQDRSGKYRPQQIYRPTYRPTTYRPRIYQGQYRPINYSPYKSSNDGRYRPSDDGRYRPGNDGRYIKTNEEKYSQGDLRGGQYDENAGKYKDDNSGKYSGDRGSNLEDNSGKYNANNEKGLSDTSGQYKSDSSGLYSGGRGGLGNYVKAFEKPTLRPLVKGIGSAEGGSGWRIIRDIKSIDEDGYHYLYETENGILAEESGKIENKGTDIEGLRSDGFYEYTGSDGQLYRVDYVADLNGFVPRGEHIPKTPPLIEKLVAYLATKPPVIEK